MRARSTAAALAALALLAPAAPTAAQAPAPPPTPTPGDGLARDPQLRPPTVKIGWAGDIAFSSRQGLPRGGPERALRGVAGYLTGVDTMAGNLEGTLGHGGASKCSRGLSNCYAFQAPASWARGLRAAGFDLMNNANNHFNDYGTTGRRQTLAALRGAHIAHTGQPGQITIVRVRTLRVAYVGFAPYPWAASLLDIPAARRLVARAAHHADLVVAIVHAGAEGAGATHVPHGGETAFGENRGRSRAFAHAVVSAGADLVVGSGPHVLRGIECYRRRVIAYSLGNFAGYRTVGTGGVLSLSGVLHIELDRHGGLLGGRLLPVHLVSPGIPRRGGASISQVRRLSRHDFGGRACAISHRGAIRLP